MKKLFWLLVAVLVMSTALAQQTRLRVFVGGQQRPDVMRKILDIYQQRNPGVRVDIEVGGATSDQQQQYLTTVLASRDPSIDIILIDVIRPAQYLASRWADTLDKYLPAASRQNLLRQYLPAYSQANVINGQLVALPAFADAMFLYYRADLLEKYNFKPPPPGMRSSSKPRPSCSARTTPTSTVSAISAHPSRGRSAPSCSPSGQRAAM